MPASARINEQLVKILYYILCVLCVTRITVSAGSERRPAKTAWFKLDPPAKRVLFEKAVTLKRGDSYESVTNQLGTPTYDRRVAPKESNRIIGRSLTYYAVKLDKNLVNELQDELVDVFLDEKNKVQSVYIRGSLD